LCSSVILSDLCLKAASKNPALVAIVRCQQKITHLYAPRSFLLTPRLETLALAILPAIQILVPGSAVAGHQEYSLEPVLAGVRGKTKRQNPKNWKNRHTRIYVKIVMVTGGLAC